MIMESTRLIFREYTMEDFDSLYAILSDPETMAFYPKPYDEKGTKRWLEWSLQNYREQGFGWWALVRKDTGEFIGDCGITLQNINGTLLPEIGYHIHKKHWRQGFGKEAARTVRDWGFRNRDFDALYSYMNAGNIASWSTAASVGMQRIGEYADKEDGLLYIYRITREEWENRSRVRGAEKSIPELQQEFSDALTAFSSGDGETDRDRLFISYNVLLNRAKTDPAVLQKVFRALVQALDNAPDGEVAQVLYLYTFRDFLESHGAEPAVRETVRKILDSGKMKKLPLQIALGRYR